VGRGDLRVVDPLYAALRQLGALVHSDYAVVPVGVSETEVAEVTVLEMAVAVVDIRGGRVLWLHTIRGEGNPAAGGAVASLAEAVARSLVR
jgi:hypothetical protein